jgi:hypothetical protein
MGEARNLIRDRIVADKERCRREGLVISDAEFDALEREIDGRHGLVGWNDCPAEVTMYGVRLLDESGAQRKWPKVVLLNTPIRFGLRAQGHLPTIRRMLSEGASWEEIGREINWCPDTAREHYEREIGGENE